MSVNWVMRNQEGNFVLLPGERHIWRSSPRTAFSLTSPRSYPGQNPINIQCTAGVLYLTNQRIVYLPEKVGPDFQSFSASLLNLHDTHTVLPWFGPNAWVAIVEPVAGGNIPQEHHIELKITFNDGGAPDYSANFERIKERLQQAVDVARESNMNGRPQAGVAGVNLESVHLDQLPTYESSATDRMAPEASQELVQTYPTRSAAPPTGGAGLSQPEAPAEAPPGYEETQQRSVQEELDRRFAA
ncbi:uncharacterized protein HMPREF1541_02536 [Cyphellophora europaea CBS 101466]|uniref:WW domain-containing protein n=1 Tax=Cyphellophora europaea (strain CBS 101466) TaxID=1220924 RepID=W2S3Y5_CYPE1|nr:uncharacterized protein HMPREF1541_02536 [Cyphellophora europaea CBS 101466]ETN43377.1 hypothetical protein HMPREF1541_02536 [Cyphellophora europaea CBS 101466]